MRCVIWGSHSEWGSQTTTNILPLTHVMMAPGAAEVKTEVKVEPP